MTIHFSEDEENTLRTGWHDEDCFTGGGCADDDNDMDIDDNMSLDWNPADNFKIDILLNHKTNMEDC